MPMPKFDLNVCKFRQTFPLTFHMLQTKDKVSRFVRKPFFFAYAKTKLQISCAVTAQLISAFVFATQIVHSLYFLNPNFQASSHFLWLPSPVCVGPGRKLRRPVFSERGSCNAAHMLFLYCCWYNATGFVLALHSMPMLKFDLNVCKFRQTFPLTFHMSQTKDKVISCNFSRLL